MLQLKGLMRLDREYPLKIYKTVFQKPEIFPGMADMNIADITTLAKKFKKDLKPLFFKLIFLFFDCKELFEVIHFKCYERKSTK